MCLLKLLPLTLVLNRLVLAHPAKMDIIRPFQNISWCKPDWCFPSMSKETNELLRQCANASKVEVSDDIDEFIKRSKAFPIPFPIESVRLEQLKERRPIDKLKRNIVSAYPIIHERVLLLMTHFLIYKREFGTSIEKAFYKDMTVLELIDRILKKRAITFMDAHDYYKLITGEEGEDGWESIGSLQQRPPLVLSRCLSYDELKLSAVLGVSSRSACLNDGRRTNAGALGEDAETDAVIIGQVGARFERKFRMEYEDILITEQQNCLENGYGEEVTPTTCLNVLKTTYVRNNQSARHMWRQMWSEFYQVHSYTYEELLCYINLQDKSEEKKYTDRYVPIGDMVFDNEVYYKRISILAETTLLEAEERAKEDGKDAFVNVVGLGLGVWKISPHQTDVYILTFLERIRSFLKKDLLNHVSDVNFAYLKPSSGILSLFSSEESREERRLFLESKRHPRGGVNVQLVDREPSGKLTGEHEGKLLVMTYPWDGNAHPGNEFCAICTDSICALFLLKRLAGQSVGVLSLISSEGSREERVQSDRGGVNVQLVDREPSGKLTGEHEGKLLVMTYPWDGNAHPGNEFWIGSLSGSGDPAAASSTQIAELHNAHINDAVCAARTRVAGRAGLKPIAEYCAALIA